MQNTEHPSNFEQPTDEFIRRLRETDVPVVLTVDGQIELIVRDAGSRRQILAIAERARGLEHLRSSIEDMKAGRVVPAEDVLDEIRQILATKPSPP